MRGLLALLLGLAAALIYQRARASTAPDLTGDETPSGSTGAAAASKNLTAFLRLVRVAESGDDYSALVGGGNITDFSRHPAALGWPGIRTADGRKSTAAGAYQITLTTWNEITPKVFRTGVDENGNNLADFTPGSQDQAALWIIQFKRPGAWTLIAEGKLNEALTRLRQEWESFDRMLTGNYSITLAQAQDIYIMAGGSVA